MRFYQATTFLFPRNYQLRLFAVCFGAVHIPLLSFCAAEFFAHNWEWRIFLPLLVGTLIGTAVAIGAVWALLAPVERATRLLQSVQRGEPVPPVPDGGQDLIGDLLRGVSRAAAETAARIDRLVDAAEKDMLTGLRNRRGFFDAVAPLLRADRTSVVALIDLDHFKRINDRFGHDEGDRVLKAFGGRLEKGVRRSDLAARWGGEEFAILLPDTGLDEAKLVVDRIRLSLHADAIGMPDAAPVTFSCGLAVVRDYPTLAAGMKKADTALYQAKHRGRDRIEI